MMALRIFGGQPVHSPAKGDYSPPGEDTSPVVEIRRDSWVLSSLSSALDAKWHEYARLHEIDIPR